jgi:vancomycin resistance protein VanJ
MAKKSERKSMPASAGSPGLARRTFGLLLRMGWIAAAWVATLVLPFALLLRLTLKDGFAPLAILFYATPWPVLAICAALCVIHWWKRFPKLRLATLPILGLCAGMAIYRGVGLGPVSNERADFRIAYWNVARPEWRLDRVLAQSNAIAADLYVFGEHREGRRTPEAWNSNFADRHVLPLERELLLVTPTEANRLDRGSLNGVGGFQFFRSVIKGREVFLLMVDFTASPFLPREPGFDRLFRIVDAYSEHPLIVIGDFNTPADSVHFDRLRARLTNAFETAGRGYAATWPMPLPVLQLDHIWTTKHLRVIRCEHRTSLWSDHRAIVADVVFSD